MQNANRKFVIWLLLDLDGMTGNERKLLFNIANACGICDVDQSTNAVLEFLESAEKLITQWALCIATAWCGAISKNDPQSSHGLLSTVGSRVRFKLVEFWNALKHLWVFHVDKPNMIDTFPLSIPSPHWKLRVENIEMDFNVPFRFVFCILTYMGRKSDDD